MNVLSLFDGISCGRVALDRAGIKYDKYFWRIVEWNILTNFKNDFGITITNNEYKYYYDIISLSIVQISLVYLLIMVVVIKVCYRI
jgi:DNA (cytosine-5)-methyltransferase 3A